MNCPRCGSANGENSRFCSTCGTALKEAGLLICSRCGTQNALDGHFCSYCGMSLSVVDQKEEPGKPGFEARVGPSLPSPSPLPIEPQADDLPAWLLEAEEAPSWLEEESQS